MDEAHDKDRGDKPVGKPRPKLNAREIGLAPGALCGSYACGGCYDVDGATIHPPRPGYRQADLMELDE